MRSRAFGLVGSFLLLGLVSEARADGACYFAPLSAQFSPGDGWEVRRGSARINFVCDRTSMACDFSWLDEGRNGPFRGRCAAGTKINVLGGSLILPAPPACDLFVGSSISC